MAEVDGQTLMMVVQAVRDEVARLEELLRSETLRDREALTELLMSNDRAAESLKTAYLAERKGGRVSLPPYEELIARAGLLPD